VTLWKSGLAFVDSVGEMMGAWLAAADGSAGVAATVVLVDSAGWAVDCAVAAAVGKAVLPALPAVHPAVAVLRAVEACSVTHLTILPSLLDAVLAVAADGSLASLRVVNCSGEVFSWETAARLRQAAPSARLWNVYGCAEVNADAAAWEAAPALLANLPPATAAAMLRMHPLSAFRPGATLQLDARVPVGRPFPGNALLLLPMTAAAPEVDVGAAAVPQAVGPRLVVLSQPGRIAVEGAGVGDGYVGLDGTATAGAAAAAGFHRAHGRGAEPRRFVTGDVGVWVALCEATSRGAGEPSGGEATSRGAGEPSGGEATTQGAGEPSGGEAASRGTGEPSGGEAASRGTGEPVACCCGCGAPALMLVLGRAAQLSTSGEWCFGDVKIRGALVDTRAVAASVRSATAPSGVVWCEVAAHTARQQLHVFVAVLTVTGTPPPSVNAARSAVARAGFPGAAVVHCFADASEGSTPLPPLPRLLSGKVDVGAVTRFALATSAVHVADARESALWRALAAVAPHVAGLVHGEPAAAAAEVLRRSWSELGVDSLQTVRLWSELCESGFAGLTLDALWSVGSPMGLLERWTRSAAAETGGAQAAAVTASANGSETAARALGRDAEPVTRLLYVVEHPGTPHAQRWESVAPAPGVPAPSQAPSAASTHPAAAAGSKRRPDYALEADARKRGRASDTAAAPRDAPAAAATTTGGTATLMARFAMDACVDAQPLPLLVVGQAWWESVCVVGSHGGDVMCVRLAGSMHPAGDSSLVWHHRRLPDRVEGAAAYHHASHTAAVPCYDGRLYGMCLSSGCVVWQWDAFPGAPHRRSREWGETDTHTADAADTHTADAADTHTADAADTHTAGARQPFKAPPLVLPDGQTMLAAGYNATAHLLLWGDGVAVDAGRVALPGAVTAAPVMLRAPASGRGDACDVAIVGCLSGHVVALQCHRGSGAASPLRVLWCVAVGAPIFAQPLACGVSDAIVVATAAGVLHALRADTGAEMGQLRVPLAATVQPLWATAPLRDSPSGCDFACSSASGLVQCCRVTPLSASPVGPLGPPVSVSQSATTGAPSSVVGRAAAVWYDGRLLMAAVATDGTAAVWQSCTSTATTSGPAVTRWQAVSGGEAFGAAAWLPLAGSETPHAEAGLALVVGGRDDGVWVWRWSEAR
jgi:hypothetical protein